MQPPLPLHSFLPEHEWSSVLQPPLPLHSFLPAQQGLASAALPAGVAVAAWLAPAPLAAAEPVADLAELEPRASAEAEAVVLSPQAARVESPATAANTTR